MSELTNRQQQVYDMVASYHQQHGIAPTNAELAVMMGASSPNAAAEHLRALQRKGVISIIPHVSRGIILNTKPAAPNEEAIAVIRSLLNGEAGAREQATEFLTHHEVTE